MAFDSQTRSRLSRFVTACRDLLTAEFDAKFQEFYGIYANEGRVLDIEKLVHLDDERLRVARLLRERIEHIASTDASGGLKGAVKRVLREQAFTVLNRVAALRMAEQRGIIVESVGGGLNSKAFKAFSEIARSGLGEAYSRYRVFLNCLFDELATDLGILFDRGSPLGLLFPREDVLLKLFDLLNASDLRCLWSEDETVGWIYQYYNDEAERKKMREESSAPRNSRELAVRNQFFTPRYVVEFLTDNSLGRLWYEMTRGGTALRDCCRHLVRRPTEIFLQPGEAAPESVKVGEDPFQEELIRQPIRIPHRPLKDPREIRLLDPACGSMHFGLYAFDLFTVIYEEAWEIAHGKDDAAKSAETFAPFVLFAASFADKAAFVREIPRLIVEHNIHGVDIDPRATQIAGLSLWLRAQRAWHEVGVKPANRPRITRSNIVCAEPMPGEKELLREFVEQQFPPGERPAFSFLLETIFDRMTLAGEAGSLLRIEEEIRTAIADAMRLWKQGHRHTQALLFAEPVERTFQGELRLDLSGISDEQFWERAEQRIYDALETYAGQTEKSGGFQRRLFADDAAQGFAFIDLCRKRYDVVVMNPPFGEQTEDLKAYLAKQYARTKNNLYCAFVERAYGYCPTGIVGVISARTFVMYRDFEEFREIFLLNSARIQAFADLGWEVLDGAQVETAAFVLARGAAWSAESGKSPIGPFIKLLTVGLDEKREALLEACNNPATSKDVFFVRRDQFSALPGSPLAYWASRNLVKLFSESATFEPALAYCGRGAAAHAFFFRLAWEIPSDQSTLQNWRRIAHGGEYSPFFRENSVFIYWKDSGREVKEYILKQYPYLNGNFGWAIQDEDKYGRVGLTSGKRNERFNVQLMPAGHIFTHEGQGFIPNRIEDVWFCLGYLNSSLVSYFLALTSGLQKTWVYIRPVPVVSLDSTTRRFVEVAARDNFELKRSWIAGAEESSWFIHPWSLRDVAKRTIAAAVSELLQRHVDDSEAINQRRTDLSNSILASLQLDSNDIAEVASDFQRHPPDVALPQWRDTKESDVLREYAARAASYFVGIAFGRWDIRFATGERQTAVLPDPFAPLPVCPPGMLQGDDGLPLSPEAGRRLRAAGRYSLDVAWDGILVEDPEHPLDIERRVHAAFATIWADRAEALEHETCGLLGVSTLREWFRRPASFFADHLKRYSKSRRQAPIYWPLSTASGSYTLWIYYHRLTDQTLYQCINDFVKPKIAAVGGDLARAMTTAGDERAKRTEIERLTSFRAELVDFLNELLRVAELPYKPNLNDGVLITAAPLWRLFRLPKWQKSLKDCWEAMEEGEYDWAHIALSLWPDRVKKACERDRSIAIAHGLESLCKVAGPSAKARKPRAAKTQLELEE